MKIGLGVDPSLVRLGTLLLALFTVILRVALTYITAWLLLPEGEEWKYL